MWFHDSPKKIVRVGSILILLVFVCFCDVGRTATFSRSSGELRKWSFFFQNCAISDALKYIKEHTGVHISLNKKITKRVVQKSYKNVDIPFIIRDMLANEDYGMMLGFHGDRLVSINVCVTGGHDRISNNELSALSESNMTNTKNRIQEIDDHREGQLPHHRDKEVDKSKADATIQKLGTSSVRWVANKETALASHDSTGTTENQNEKALATVSETSENDDTVDSESKHVDPAKKKSVEPPPMPPGF
jgi:hypothetical protein